MSGLQFKAELVRKIMRGEKTQTRRPVKRDQAAHWKPTRTYAVQPGRGKPAMCRIEILDVRQERLGEITFEDARAEGFRTTDEFKTYWVRLHDKPWTTRGIRVPCDCWTHGKPGEHFHIRPLEEHDMLARFEARHANDRTWVITFKLDHTHVPRLLAARPAPDYVTDPRLALPSEPEAISEDDWKRHVDAHRDRKAQEWQGLEERQRELDRRMLSQEERIARMRREAHLRGVDVTRELWLLQKRLPNLAGDSLERHIKGVEARIYRIAA